jgi:hypothetical protein
MNDAHPKGFGKPQNEPPTSWTNRPLRDRIVDVGGGIYYAILEDGIVQGEKATNVWVWHWHTPTKGAHRWALSGCGLHTVLQVVPLTLDPSLACEDGCPSHGWLKNGVWTPC